MATISKKRQREISSDSFIVQRIYEAACRQWGNDAIHKDLTRIWDLRCIWGMQNIIPFRSMASQNLSELLWVAENVCGIHRA